MTATMQLPAGPAVLPPAPCAGMTRARSLLQRALLRRLVDLWCTPLEISGLEHLPDSPRPLLFAPNHASHLDAPLLAAALPAGRRRSLAVAAAADYFFTSPLLGAFVSLGINAYPFHRDGGSRVSLRVSEELLAAGWSVLLFPEGSRGTGGRVGVFRSGLGRLASRTGAPVVPVYIGGTAQRLPKGCRFPRRGPAAVRFGEAIAYSPGADPRDVADDVRARVIELAG